MNQSPLGSALLGESCNPPAAVAVINVENGVFSGQSGDIGIRENRQSRVNREIFFGSIPVPENLWRRSPPFESNEIAIRWFAEVFEVSIVKVAPVIPDLLLAEEFKVVTVKVSMKPSFQRLVVEPRL